MLVLPCLYGVFGNGVWWVECLCSLVKCSTYKQSSQDTMNEKRKEISNFAGWRNVFHLSPVLSKRPIVLLHGLDFWVLVSIFFLFHCRLHKGCCFFFPSNFRPSMSIRLKLQYRLIMCELPGYLPPLFLLMKHTMRRTKMRRAMAHINPINHPWVAMSTCRLGTAARAFTQKEGGGRERWRH